MLRSTRRRAARPGGTALLLLAIALLMGCSSHRQERVDEREYASYRRDGNATIEGQVKMTLANGQLLYGSACQVRLMPITSSSTSYVQDVVMTGGTKAPEPGPDAIWWVEEADLEGRFRFVDVPAGSYYVICPVAWREPSGDARQKILWTETTVGPGQTVQVAVSR